MISKRNFHFTHSLTLFRSLYLFISIYLILIYLSCLLIVVYILSINVCLCVCMELDRAYLVWWKKGKKFVSKSNFCIKTQSVWCSLMPIEEVFAICPVYAEELHQPPLGCILFLFTSSGPALITKARLVVLGKLSQKRVRLVSGIPSAIIVFIFLLSECSSKGKSKRNQSVRIGICVCKLVDFNYSISVISDDLEYLDFLLFSKCYNMKILSKSS